MPGHSIRSATKNSSEPFDFEQHLPPELAAIKPLWVIPVSVNWSVWVFKTPGFVKTVNAQGTVMSKEGEVFQATLRNNKSGLPHRTVSLTGYNNRRREYQSYETLFDLRAAIDSVALELRPKVTTTSVAVDEDN